MLGGDLVMSQNLRHLLTANKSTNVAIIIMAAIIACLPMGSSAIEMDNTETELIHYSNTKHHINTDKDPVRQSMKLGIDALLAGNAKLANHKFMPASFVTIPKY